MNTKYLELNGILLQTALSEIVETAEMATPTKRHAVHIVGRFYDPIGYLAPIIIRFKILLKEICDAKLSWDEQLTGELLKNWKRLITELKDSDAIEIPRCYVRREEYNGCRLVGFCDASVRAYAAVIYLVTNNQQVSFVTAKTRVAPSQSMTIPRLELLSTLLLARLLTAALRDTIVLGAPICFSDSKVALYWINGSEKEWKPFVQNRVNEIQRLLSSNCWHHCPGHENPADIPSRGMSPSELQTNLQWHEWLKHLVDEEIEAESNAPKECFVKMKPRILKDYCNLVTERNSVRKLWTCEDYSTLGKLLQGVF